MGVLDSASISPPPRLQAAPAKNRREYYAMRFGAATGGDELAASPARRRPGIETEAYADV
jgi:hypothetical protein